jgi:hypothetical protein
MHFALCKEQQQSQKQEVVQVKSSQVKLRIANNTFFIVQRATEQSNISFHDYGLAEALLS